jgi:hypothetical protein
MLYKYSKDIVNFYFYRNSIKLRNVGLLSTMSLTDQIGQVFFIIMAIYVKVKLYIERWII